MTEHRTQDEAKLRRALRTLDDQAPISPSLSDLQTAAAYPSRWKSIQPAWIALAAFTVTLISVIPVVLLSGRGEPGPAGASLPPSPPTTEQVTTTTFPSVERLPLDGRPEDLGVETVEFIPVMFPTSAEEFRQFVVWETVKTNVGLYQQEICMTAEGQTVEMPRYLAVDLRRYAVMPDFELDAEYGVTGGDSVEYTNPAPPTGLTGEERAAWQTAYSQCGSQWEEKVSTEFEQLVGSMRGEWFDHITEVTESEAMSNVTEDILTCVAEGGGPSVGSIADLYDDRISQDAASLEELRTTWDVLATLIYGCAGDYDQVRQKLLIPIRDQVVDKYSNTLAQVEPFFNEVMMASGISATP